VLRELSTPSDFKLRHYPFSSNILLTIVMEAYWNNFIASFCKVEFLCYAYEPNWLGWVLIAWLGVMVVGVIVLLLALMTS